MLLRKNLSGVHCSQAKGNNDSRISALALTWGHPCGLAASVHAVVSSLAIQLAVTNASRWRASRVRAECALACVSISPMRSHWTFHSSMVAAGLPLTCRPLCAVAWQSAS